MFSVLIQLNVLLGGAWGAGIPTASIAAAVSFPFSLAVTFLVKGVDAAFEFLQLLAVDQLAFPVGPL